MYINYGMNSRLGDRDISKAYPITRFRAGTALLSEGVYYLGGPWFMANISELTGERPSGVHSGRANVLFVGGHVKSVAKVEFPTDKEDIFWKGEQK
jgi:prepilin-type processing-associated H-X9-DG protein